MRRMIPFIRQMEYADCGAACLAMVLGYFGKRVDLRELRDLTGAGRDGVTALSVVSAARASGLRVRGVRADLDDLRHLPRGSILHWEFSHFVVFERTTRKGIRVVDPARGRRVVSMDDLRHAYTGVAILCEPSDSFDRGRSPAKGTWRVSAADAPAVKEHGQGHHHITGHQARRARTASAHRARRRRDRPAQRPPSSPGAHPRRCPGHRLQLLVRVPARQPAGRAADPV